MAQLFRADTRTPVVEDELPIIGTVVPVDDPAETPPGAVGNGVGGEAAEKAM